MTDTSAAPARRRTGARAEQAALSRQRLVDAAISAFSEQEYEEVAVADIARLAGVAHGLLYHYFGNKRGLYHEAMREAATQMSSSFALRSGLTPEQQVRESLASHLRFLSAHRGLALRLVLSGRGTDPEAWAVFEAARWTVLDQMFAMLGLDPDNAALKLVGRTAIGAIDEATVYWLENDQSYDLETMVEYLVRVASSSLLAAPVLDAGLRVAGVYGGAAQDPSEID